MGYNKKIRFEYYEVVYRENNDPATQPDRAYDLRVWLDKASPLTLSERTFDYSQEKARLEDFWFDHGNQLSFINFLKLRATNIPSKAKEDEQAEPIELDDDEYIGEGACAIYDHGNSVLMLQRNFHSLGPRGIEYYINKLWNSDHEIIYLRPICPLNIQTIARRAPEYRKFTIRFADVNKNTIDGNGPLKVIFDNIKTYGCVNAEISITMGYERGMALDNATVRESIDEAVENKGIVSKAELTLKNDEGSPVEILDLFEEKLHDFIYVNLEKRQTLLSEFLALKMADRYNESRGKIVAAMRERG